MGLTFFDPRSGAPREFRPASPPRVGVEAGTGGPRDERLRAVLGRTLVFLGYRPEPGREIRVGGEDPGPGAVWLRAAPLVGGAMFDSRRALRSGGCSSEDLDYLHLKTHYREPLACSWDALAAARAERADLSAAARGLAGISLEPSSRACAGYSHRFRVALSRDLDLPGALDCVWDALRPGALSPGSKAAFLRAALPALDFQF